MFSHLARIKTKRAKIGMEDGRKKNIKDSSEEFSSMGTIGKK